MVKQTRGYRVWDPTSEDALKSGVRKHGLGAWEHIRKDPQFAILSDRTGVQLKDKWRNLVKFRHIDPDEQRTYKPKTQGPWSKKYKRERTQGLSGTASPASGDGGSISEEEGIQQAVDSQAIMLRQSGRTNAQKRKAISDLAALLEGDCGADPYTASEGEVEHPQLPGLSGVGASGGPTGVAGGAEGDGSGLKRSRPRSSSRGPVGRGTSARVRKATEDRRFGIYDRRRYGFAEDGSVLPRGRSCDGDASGAGSESDGDRGGDGGGALTAIMAVGPVRVRRRAGIAGRRGGRGASDDDDDEEEDMEYPGSGSGGDAAMDAAAGGGKVRCIHGGSCGISGPVEEYVISCPCGVTYDDGEMMIECESCNAWAHIACLRQQMANAPDRLHYDFETYHCHGCQAALHSLQHGNISTGGGVFGHVSFGHSASPDTTTGLELTMASRSRRALQPAGVLGSSATAAVSRNNTLQELGNLAAVAVDGQVAVEQDARDQHQDLDGGDADTASEDSQRKASELSNILLGMANGRMGNGGGSAAAARRGGGGNASGHLSKLGPFGRTSSGAVGHRSAGGGANGTCSGVGGGGGSPIARSGSIGHTSSSGLGGAAATGVGDQGGSAAALVRDGSGRLLRLGQQSGAAAATAAAEAGLRKLAAGVSGGIGSGGPTNSTGSRGGLDGAGSPPPLLDTGLPLFQGAAGQGTSAVTSCSGGGGGGGASGVFFLGSRIIKPVPKLATAVGLTTGHHHQLQLSAPKARPHPALQRDASQHSLHRMLEMANPMMMGGGSNGRGLPLTTVLEAAGSLHVAAANLCAASGRKALAAAAAASVSTGGAAAASECVDSCDAAATAGGGGGPLPPRPPSRPPSSMAREVANRIFGESDDDDAGGSRPLSALRGGDPWFLMPSSLSRATTPSAFLENILRATPDILPLPGTSPPPHLVAALAAARSVSPGAAYLPALLAHQQHQQHQHAVLQQFINQTATPPTASTTLQPPSAATATASVAGSLILPPPPLACSQALAAAAAAPPFAPPPMSLGGASSPWPPTAPPPPPPPPGSMHPTSNNGDPVTLHPVLQNLLMSTAQQQQQQQQQQQRSADCSGAHQQQAALGSAASVANSEGGSAVGLAKVKEEAGSMPPPQPHTQAQQQQQQQPNDISGQEVAATNAGTDRHGGGGGRAAFSLVVQPLGRASATPPLPNSGGGSGLAAAAAVGHLRDVAMAAAAAGCSNGGALAPVMTGLDSNGSSSVAALLGFGVGSLHLNVLDQLRSSSPDLWGGFFRTSTPGPEAILQSFPAPPVGDLPWLKSTTPPLSGAFAEILGHQQSCADLSMGDR